VSRVGYSDADVAGRTYAMKLMTAAGLESSGLRAAFIQGDAGALPLRSASIDRVFLITVLGEIPDRAGALGEMGRVLRPGGRLSVGEQFPDPDFVTRSALRRELTGAGFVEEKTAGWLVYTSTWVKRPARNA
jgi:ubiquinone/menaquinone biosynthesis C-methylase UbiE